MLSLYSVGSYDSKGSLTHLHPPTLKPTFEQLLTDHTDVRTFNQAVRAEIEHSFTNFEKTTNHYIARSLHQPLITIQLAQYFLCGNFAKAEDIHTKTVLQQKFHLG